MPQPMRVVLVEHERPAAADREEVTRRIERCLALRNARWMRSYYTPDGRRSICQFEAPTWSRCGRPSGPLGSDVFMSTSRP